VIVVSTLSIHLKNAFITLPPNHLPMYRFVMFFPPDKTTIPPPKRTQTGASQAAADRSREPDEVGGQGVQEVDVQPSWPCQRRTALSDCHQSCPASALAWYAATATDASN
jgi:hypothetical protein